MKLNETLLRRSSSAWQVLLVPFRFLVDALQTRELSNGELHSQLSPTAPHSYEPSEPCSLMKNSFGKLLSSEFLRCSRNGFNSKLIKVIIISSVLVISLYFISLYFRLPLSVDFIIRKNLLSMIFERETFFLIFKRHRWLETLKSERSCNDCECKCEGNGISWTDRRSTFCFWKNFWNSKLKSDAAYFRGAKIVFTPLSLVSVRLAHFMLLMADLVECQANNLST